uniref:Uncharacterized protein n=1 Tax=Anopheles culicifacies TaxID=139723 RepID=A0A182MTI0_9DIPT
MTSMSSDSRTLGSSNGGDVANNNNHLPKDAPAADIIVCRTKVRDRGPAVGNGHVAGRADDTVDAMCRLDTPHRAANPRAQKELPARQSARMSNAHAFSAVTPSTIDSCDPARSVEASVCAAGTSSSTTTRHHQSSLAHRNSGRDMTDSTSAVSSTVVELEDPYAELERILEKVQGVVGWLVESYVNQYCFLPRFGKKYSSGELPSSTSNLPFLISSPVVGAFLPRFGTK